ncbi:MAG TPA: tetratricopeptide repeat protein [Candidatus Dormibacteraeota bacterium]|nr:tetratricopeptide repeat protein [Candidatus Dormibacteraeota bacterium]
MKPIPHTLQFFLAVCLFFTFSSWAQSTNNQSQNPSSASPTNGTTDLVKQGRKLNSEGKQDEAIALYRRALQQSPNLAEAHLATGMALDLQGKYDEARTHLAKAIELSSEDKVKFQALKTMAISYAFEQNAAEASKFERQVFDAQSAAHDYPAAAETANEAARICLESGDPAWANKWYQTGYTTSQRKPDLTAAERDLWDFRWEHAQARIAARQGKHDEAQKHVAAAKAIFDKGSNPQQAPYFPYLAGYVAFYAKEYNAAIAELQKADQRDPFILSLLAQAYEKSGNKTQAMTYYRQVLTSNAHNPTNAFARPLAKKKIAELGA